MSASLLSPVYCLGEGGVTGDLSPPSLHNLSHLDITHLYLLAGLAPLVVVVDGEDPKTPGVLLVWVLPHASLPTGRVTVCSYHRLGRVGRLEIIGHRPVMMIMMMMVVTESVLTESAWPIVTWSHGSCGLPAASVLPSLSACSTSAWPA